MLPSGQTYGGQFFASIAGIFTVIPTGKDQSRTMVSMINCTNCGEQNPDGTSRCNRCGVILGHQIRAKEDAKRAQTMKMVKIGVWLVGLIIVGIVGPKVYHVGAVAYYKHHLQSMTEHANIYCNGPIKDDMSPAQKDEINKCLDKDQELVKAKADYAELTKGDTP